MNSKFQVVHDSCRFIDFTSLTLTQQMSHLLMSCRTPAAAGSAAGAVPLLPALLLLHLPLLLLPLLLLLLLLLAAVLRVLRAPGSARVLLSTTHQPAALLVCLLCHLAVG
jgi:hypothetical protein